MVQEMFFKSISYLELWPPSLTLVNKHYQRKENYTIDMNCLSSAQEVFKNEHSNKS